MESIEISIGTQWKAQEDRRGWTEDEDETLERIPIQLKVPTRWQWLQQKGEKKKWNLNWSKESRICWVCCQHEALRKEKSIKYDEERTGPYFKGSVWPKIWE